MQNIPLSYGSWIDQHTERLPRIPAQGSGYALLCLDSAAAEFNEVLLTQNEVKFALLCGSTLHSEAASYRPSDISLAAGKFH